MSGCHTAVSIVEHYLSSLIMKARLKVAAQVPPERQIAHDVRASRQKVREGINHLAARGILIRKPGVGTFLAADDMDALAMWIPFQMKQSQIFETRLTLEPYVVFLASQRASKKHLADLATALRKMDGSFNDLDGLRQFDLEFHRLLAQACDNPILSSVMNGMGCFWPHSVLDDNSSGVVMRLLDSHRKLYRAVRSMNGQRARMLSEELSQVNLARVYGESTGSAWSQLHKTNNLAGTKHIRIDPACGTILDAA